MSKSGSTDQGLRTNEQDAVSVQTEINIQRYPLWDMRSDKDDLEPRTYKKVYHDQQEGYFKREWTVVPSVELGPLGPMDQDVFTGVEELVARRGGMPKDGQLEFTLAELRRIVGWTKSGRTNRLLRESLERVAMTSIRTKNAFYAKDTESFISDTFTIWSVHFNDTVSMRGKASVHTLKFHSLFVNNWLCQYLKGLDTSLYWALESPIAKRLYRLIDEQRGKELVWDVELWELARRVPLRGAAQRSTILQRLAPAHKQLVENGFLERIDQQEDALYYVVAADFARRQRARDMSDDPRQAIALELLLGYGVRGDTARDLVLEHGPERCIYYAKAAPYQKIKKSRSGWLIEAIKEGYELGENQIPPPSTSVASMQTLFSMDELDNTQNKRTAEESSGEDTVTVVANPEAEELWQTVLGDISEQINAPSLRVWFEGTFAVAVDEQSLTICVPNNFAREYIEKRFQEIIENALSNHLSPTSALEIVVAAEGNYE